MDAFRAAVLSFPVLLAELHVSIDFLGSIPELHFSHTSGLIEGNVCLFDTLGALGAVVCLILQAVHDFRGAGGGVHALLGAIDRCSELHCFTADSLSEVVLGVAIGASGGFRVEGGAEINNADASVVGSLQSISSVAPNAIIE